MLTPNNGTPLVDLIVAESKVGFDGPVCDPNAQGGPSSGSVCPAGAQLDADRNVCIIPASSGSRVR